MVVPMKKKNEAKTFNKGKYRCIKNNANDSKFDVFFWCASTKLPSIETFHLVASTWNDRKKNFRCRRNQKGDIIKNILTALLFFSFLFFLASSSRPIKTKKNSWKFNGNFPFSHFLMPFPLPSSSSFFSANSLKNINLLPVSSGFITTFYCFTFI